MFNRKDVFGALAAGLACLFVLLQTCTAAEGESVVIDPAVAPDAVLAGPAELFDLAPELASGVTVSSLLAAGPAPEFPGAVLDLAEALRRTLSNHPELAALDKESLAVQGRLFQGSVKPNPQFEAEISDFMGTAETRYFVGAVSGFGISQLIERGRKRCARMAVAEREGQLVAYDRERTRLDIMLAVTEAYSTALVAQERLALALERERLVEQVYNTVGLRVEGGKAAKLEQTRVGIELAATRLASGSAERDQIQAMAQLASLWGGVGKEFGSVAGSLTLPDGAPELAPLLEAVEATPEMRRWAGEEQLRRAQRDLAQAEGVPDMTWSGGLERFESTDSFGFKLGVSFPLQLRRTTHGKVVEAQAYIDQVEDLRAAQQRALVAQLTEAQGRMSSAYAEARAIDSELLPSASEAFELTQVGYRFGKFGLLDVLDAQRTLIDIRDQYFAALAAYQLAAVQVERLIAQPLSPKQLTLEQDND